VFTNDVHKVRSTSIFMRREREVTGGRGEK
jgi:hypothetical protein